MECKCPGCNGTLNYDITSGKVICDYCGNKYDVESLKFDYTKDKIFNINIYTCKSCGAELYYGSKTEITSTCAYCGNQSVVFSRTDKIKMPDYIIPFKITKEKAFNIYRKKISKVFFAPEDFKKIPINKIVSVYIPFYIYDIYQYQEMQIHTQSTESKINELVSDLSITNLTCDASKQFHDISSRYLEPFNCNELKPFSPFYLTSNFYADKSDESNESMNIIASSRCNNLLVDDAEKFFGGTLINKKGFHKIKKVDYAMLPVWFLTMDYNGIPYTFMVNGQTGKFVGTFPPNKKKIKLFSILIFVFNILFFGSIGFFGLQYFGRFTAIVGFVYNFFIYFFLGGIFIGRKLIKKYKWNLSLTNEQRIKELAENRQERK